MIIQSELIRARLTNKVLSHTHDRSRHLLCPWCKVRTKLYTLNDGRKQCSICARKFTPKKKTDSVKLQQYADALLCFCMNFPAQQASALMGCRYRLIASHYEHFRSLLAEQNLTPRQMRLLTTLEKSNRAHDSAFLRRSKEKFRIRGIKKGDATVIGLKFTESGRILLEPLEDDAATFAFDKISSDTGPESRGRFLEYAGFIRQGKFQRFVDNPKFIDGAEQVCTWMNEHKRNYRGIRKRNMGLYMKEMEWKYNHRLLSPETQALKMIEFISPDFLTTWTQRAERQRKRVQKSA